MKRKIILFVVLVILPVVFIWRIATMSIDIGGPIPDRRPRMTTFFGGNLIEKQKSVALSDLKTLAKAFEWKEAQSPNNKIMKKFYLTKPLMSLIDFYCYSFISDRATGLDPWGTHYYCDGPSGQLLSAGPDKRIDLKVTDETNDDIVIRFRPSFRIAKIVLSEDRKKIKVCFTERIDSTNIDKKNFKLYCDLPKEKTFVTKISKVWEETIKGASILHLELIHIARKDARYVLVCSIPFISKTNEHLPRDYKKAYGFIEILINKLQLNRFNKQRQNSALQIYLFDDDTDSL